MLCGFAAGEMPDVNQASTTAQAVTDEEKILLCNLTCYFLVTKKVTKEVPLAHAADPAPRRGVLLRQPR